VDDLSDIFGMEADAADDFRVWEGDEGADADSGLEIDDAQAEEIRSIFLTTLPQYLEPVEQMLDQVFDGDGGGDDTRQALVATLTSLDAAAARIGLEEIVERLKRIADRVQLLDEIPDDRGTARRAIFADLAELRRLTGAADRAAASDDAGSRTILSVLRAVGRADETVLSRLTSAGLVTVDQLLMARPDEITAVSGLDRATVDRLLADVARSVTPADEANNVVELSTDGGALRAHLERKRRRQADAEAALAELRDEVQMLRRRLPELRAELASAEDRRDDLREALSRVRERIADSTRELDEALAARREVAGRHATAEETTTARETRVRQLRRERQAAIEERAELERDVASLVDRVQRMLEHTIRG